MKNINVIILIVSGLLQLVSCDMEVVPPSEISEQNFWKTEKDAWYALNACYSKLQGFDVYDEMCVDNVHSHKPWEGPFELVQQGTVTPSDDMGYNYSGIRMYNNFLENVDKCAMPEDIRERMKAEARFLRAFDYTDMVSKFGGVPLVTTVMPYDAPNVPRDSEKTVQDFILKELTEIASILPNEYSGDYLYEHGRFTRSAALALKARAALNFKDYKIAEEAARTIMTEGHHSLFRVSSLNPAQQREADEMDTYIDFEKYGIDKDKFVKGLFSYETLWHGNNADPQNPEYIVTRQYMADDKHCDHTRYIYIRPSQMVKGYSSYEPMQDLVDAYWNIDGQTLPASIPVETRQKNFDVMNDIVLDWCDTQKKHFNELVPSLDLKSFDYVQEFRNRDSRLYASILFPFKGWHETDAGNPFYYRWFPEKIGRDGNESWSGYSFRKMVALTPYNEENSADDYPTIRYAEVLLTFAEARIQNVGWDGEVQAALNDIRNRCGMPDVPETMLSKQAALDFVYNERRIELAGEGQRFADIRRAGNEYVSKYMRTTTYAPNGYVLVAKNWSDHLMLMPIPQSARDFNPLLEQNPGY